MYPIREIESLTRYHNIPDPVSMSGWKNMPIKPDEQSLVMINHLDNRIKVQAMYFEQGIQHASNNLYCREKVVVMLSTAVKSLPSGLCLLVWDSYRPYLVQQALYDEYHHRIHNQNPSWSTDVVSQEAQKYVSLPSTDPLRPSPHLTGGAIDLTICEEDGTLLDMGTNFDHFGSESSTNFYEKTSLPIKWNRRLLHLVMTDNGFTNYPEEWWHFDYGNQFWAKIGNHPYAIFGPTFTNNLTD